MNYLFTQFKSFIRSPIFTKSLIIFITIASTIIFIIYYTPIMLCDDGDPKVYQSSLYETKLTLIHHLFTNDMYKASISYYENLSYLQSHHMPNDQVARDETYRMITHYNNLQYINMNEIIKLQEEIQARDPNTIYPPSFRWFHPRHGT